jgi:hypothetical protein
MARPIRMARAGELNRNCLVRRNCMSDAPSSNAQRASGTIKAALEAAVEASEVKDRLLVTDPPVAVAKIKNSGH